MTQGRPGTALLPERRRSAVALDRDAYRRRATVRSASLAAVSTVVVATLLVVVITGSSGWPRVKESFFDLEIGRDATRPILEGLWMNIRITVVAAVAILVVGLAVAVLRTLQGPVFFPVRLLAAAYTDVFRGLPLILLLLLIGFGVPGLRIDALPNEPVVLGGVALVLTYSAYVSEVFRAGIESVHPSQRAAARSLGLTNAQTLRHVVLPQAIRRVHPPLLNDLVSLQKDSGLVSILGVIDAIRAAQIESANSANFTPYVVAGLAFLILTIPLTRLTDWLSRRATRRQGQGGTA